MKTFKVILIIGQLVFFMNIANAVNSEYNIIDYGAKNDTTYVSTYEIQKAIDVCAENGGGKVIVPKGSFVTGTLFLKRNVNLHLLPDAHLLGSTSLDDYSTNVYVPREAPRYAKCLIFADKADNISITGQGTINGRGYKKYFEHWGERPMLIRLVKCNNVLIKNVTLKNSASWNTHLINCERTWIEGIYLLNRVQSNNDGIDFDGCKDLFISNCKFDTDDDPICGKSTTDMPTENVVITNCIISSKCSGFKLGTSSKGIYRNITINNCVIKNTTRGAIKIICVDGGLIENVNISNIVMDNVEGPIFIRLGDRGKTYDVAKDQDYTVEGKDAIEETPVGKIRNIKISNIFANVTGKQEAQSGVMITGIPGYNVESVYLKNITINFPGGGTKEQAGNIIDEDAKRYPEQSFFGILPSYAFYARHVSDLQVHDWQIKYSGKEERPAFVLDDVLNSEFYFIRVMSPKGGEPLIKKTKCSGTDFSDIKSINDGNTEIVNY